MVFNVLHAMHKKCFFRFSSTCLIVVLTCFFSTAIYADSTAVATTATEDLMNLDLDALMNVEVTTASKKAERISDAPGIITVITRKEIESYAARTLGEILRRSPSTELLSPDIFVEQSLVIRGMETTPYNNRVLILVNGRPYRDPLTGGLNAVVFANFPADAIEHIEIIRGPGSVLYGSSAYLGVVNLITRSSKEEGTHGAVEASLGSNNFLAQSALVEFNSKYVDGLVSGYFLDESGPTYSFMGYDKKPGVGDFFRKGSSFLGNVKIWDFTLSGVYARGENFCIDGGSEIWTTDPRLKQDQISLMADLGFKKSFIKDMLGVDLNYTNNTHIWNSSSQLDTGTAHLFEANASIKIKEMANILVGYGFEHTKWTNRKFREATQNTNFGYIQGDLSPFKYGKLIAGVQINKLTSLRKDTTYSIPVHFSPRIGIIGHATDKLGAKILYESAFRRAYPNEIAFNVAVFQGNFNLKPERINTFSAQIFFDAPKISSSITYFNSTLKGVIYRKNLNPVGRPLFLYVNDSLDWKCSGIEYEGRFFITKKLMANLNATYTTNKNGAGVKNVTLHPNLMAKGGFVYTDDLFTFGLYNTMFGKPDKKTIDINAKSLMINENQKNIVWLSARLAITPIKNFSISADVDNILNRYTTYIDYANKGVNTLYPISEGRTFTAKVHFNF